MEISAGRQSHVRMIMQAEEDDGGLGSRSQGPTSTCYEKSEPAGRRMDAAQTWTFVAIMGDWKARPSSN